MKNSPLVRLGLLFIPLLVLSACDTAQEDPNRKRPFLGSENSTVVIQEFSDFQCPACGQIVPQLDAWVKANPAKARLEYWHFPLSYHENAFKAAEAAECAADQGKFWEYAETAFKNQADLSEDRLKEFAKTLDLNTESFNACLDGGLKKGNVQADQREGDRRGVPATPSLFVNGQLVKWSGIEPLAAYLESLGNR